MTGLAQIIHHALGLGAQATDLTFTQISLRGIIVFIAAIVMVRVGSKRFMSKMTAFDAVLGFILASMLARAVNGTAAFFPTLCGGFVLMGLHALFAHLAYRRCIRKLGQRNGRNCRRERKAGSRENAARTYF